MYLKRHIIIGVLFGVIVPATASDTSTSRFSWFSSLRRSSWMSWPSQETTTVIKDYARLGLLSTTGMLAGWIASTQLNVSSSLSAKMGLVLLAGLPLGLARYFWKSEHNSFHDIQTQLNAFDQKFNEDYLRNATYEQEVEWVSELTSLLDRLENYIKTTWSYAGKLTAQKVFKELEPLKKRIEFDEQLMIEEAREYKEQYEQFTQKIVNDPLYEKFAKLICEPIEYISFIDSFLATIYIASNKDKLNDIKNYFEGELTSTLHDFDLTAKDQLKNAAMLMIESKEKAKRLYYMDEAALDALATKIDENKEQILIMELITNEDAIKVVQVFIAWLDGIKNNIKEAKATVEERKRQREERSYAPTAEDAWDINEALDQLREGFTEEMLKRPMLTRENLKKAQNTLSQKYHPDKGGDAEKFKPMRSAYAYLNKYFDIFKVDIQNAYRHLQQQRRTKIPSRSTTATREPILALPPSSGQ